VGWLLEQETSFAAGSSGVLVGADRVWQKLSRPLSRLVSQGGAMAILLRALHIARKEFPFLEVLRAGTQPAPYFKGLDEGPHAVEADTAGTGLLVVLSTVLDLLAGLIGEDLVVRLVREGWPNVPVTEPSRSRHTDTQEAAS
jgi:hypothetical protein